ncbi:Protein indeterminate-domain 16 [Raphanus sativus]|uniref:Protein indeterminate-domain 16 n=1 Tax=Raphanus sativus TaxID=3726 RepID=A0A6J0NCF7_RAPSA|nr:protein indeterminate-domain 16 [Raphanus sativus]KAJ4916653.1 Protein indeterminate-domain 16 [Raphanus sativus]
MIDYERNNNHVSSSSSDLLLAINETPVNNKRKRRPAGTPDPDAEVVSLSPRTLLESDRYVCEICNQGFQRDQNLQMHRRRHKVPWKLLKREKKDEEVRKRVYVCPEQTCLHHDPCHALGDLVGIKKHFRRKHSAIKQWVCERCSKGYAVQSDYKAHLKTCGSRGHSCDCGRVFSRVESFIEHQDTCNIRRPQPTNPPRPLQQNISGHSTPSRTFSTTSIGPSLHGLPMLRPPQASHQQSLAFSYPVDASSSPFESLQLQLSIGMAKTSSNMKRNEKEEMSVALTANEEARRADEMRQEAKRQIEMAEMDLERAKNIRKQAEAELEKAQFVREEAMKRINATMLELTCRSCKQLFQLPVMADESKTSLVMSYVSSATTEGECE